MVCATHKEEEEEDISDSSSTNSNKCATTSLKRSMPEPLFLNFTSNLSPQKICKKKAKAKKQNDYRVNGVNILNRNNLDSKTAIERIQRRRENHNHVERRRRDNINSIICELSNIVPNATQPGQKPNKGNILRLSLDYIKELYAENQALKERLNPPKNILSVPNSPHHFPIIQQTHSLPTSPLDTKLTNLPIPPSISLPPPHVFHHQLQAGQQQTSILPSIRMSGYEKIYGNVCRY